MPKAKKLKDLSDIWKLKRRGQRDSDRHKELVKKAIKKSGKDLITEYNIIKSDGNKNVGKTTCSSFFVGRHAWLWQGSRGNRFGPKPETPQFSGP